jgi:oligopeptide/dipeptide ABC transporter ATP-binding protein
MTSLLSINDLWIDYQIDEITTSSISGVNLEIGRGEHVGLVGESGAGKTVVALAIMGLIRKPGRIRQGSITFDGIDLLHTSESTRNVIRGKRIALIPQDASLALNPVLRIGTQITEMVRRHLKLSASDATERARQVFRRVGLADPQRVLRSYPNELSGGMKQRVAIALALSCDPELIIADDPTSAVDVTIQAQILKELGQLTETLNVAVLFITHDLRIVSTMCTRVAVLYAGQIAETGPARTILDQPAHPYTRALLACSPTVEHRANPLPIVAGSSPDALETIAGCRFHPRCPRRLDQCSVNEPELVGNGHRVACWNPFKST